MSSSRATATPNSASAQSNPPPTTPHASAPARIQRPTVEDDHEGDEDDDSEDDDLDGSFHFLIGLVTKTLHSA